MITLRLATLGAAACLASMSMSYAGPCSGEIDRVQARFDAILCAPGKLVCQVADQRLKIAMTEN